MSQPTHVFPFAVGSLEYQILSGAFPKPIGGVSLEQIAQASRRVFEYTEQLDALLAADSALEVDSEPALFSPLQGDRCAQFDNANVPAEGQALSTVCPLRNYLRVRTLAPRRMQLMDLSPTYSPNSSPDTVIDAPVAKQIAATVEAVNQRLANMPTSSVMNVSQTVVDNRSVSQSVNVDVEYCGPSAGDVSKQDVAKFRTTKPLSLIKYKAGDPNPFFNSAGRPMIGSSSQPSIRFLSNMLSDPPEQSGIFRSCTALDCMPPPPLPALSGLEVGDLGRHLLYGSSGANSLCKITAASSSHGDDSKKKFPHRKHFKATSISNRESRRQDADDERKKGRFRSLSSHRDV